jgi:hypothetical protein
MAANLPSEVKISRAQFTIIVEHGTNITLLVGSWDSSFQRLKKANS